MHLFHLTWCGNEKKKHSHENNIEKMCFFYDRNHFWIWKRFNKIPSKPSQQTSIGTLSMWTQETRIWQIYWTIFHCHVFIRLQTMPNKKKLGNSSSINRNIFCSNAVLICFFNKYCQRAFSIRLNYLINGNLFFAEKERREKNLWCSPKKKAEKFLFNDVEKYYFLFFILTRNTVMASTSSGTNTKWTWFSCFTFANIPWHNCLQTINRCWRHKKRYVRYLFHPWRSPPLCARHGAKSWRIINVHFISHIGLSKFAKLARSVTRSRQFSAHIPTLKDPSKQSNLAQV